MQRVDLDIRDALAVDIADGDAFTAAVSLRIARRAERVRLAERALLLLALGASACVLTPWAIDLGRNVDWPTLTLSLGGCAAALWLGRRVRLPA
jgi:hypothetical protein